MAERDQTDHPLNDITWEDVDALAQVITCAGWAISYWGVESTLITRVEKLQEKLEALLPPRDLWEKT